MIQITDEACFIGFPLVISDGGLPSSARLVESMGAQVANHVCPAVSSNEIGRCTVAMSLVNCERETLQLQIQKSFALLAFQQAPTC